MGAGIEIMQYIGVCGAKFLPGSDQVWLGI